MLRCVKSDCVDLVVGRIYAKVKDEEPFVRVIDESGEDYLYPKDWFCGHETGLPEEGGVQGDSR